MLGTRAPRAILALALLLTSGCGSDEPDDGVCVAGAVESCMLADGTAGSRACGSDFRFSSCTAVVDAGVGLTPTTPAIPDFRPCPEGWRAIVEPEVIWCEPWPESGAMDCSAVDEVHFAGEAGCSRVGTTCPSDELPAGLPSDSTVSYVLAGATGDGTRATPFGTIGAANAVAMTNGVVAIGVGRYDEVIRARGNVTFHGACVSGTLLTSSEPSPATNIGVFNANRNGTTTLRNLRIGESARAAIQAAGTLTQLEVENVVIDRARTTGMLSGDGAIRTNGFVVRDTQPAPTGTLGLGIVAGLGSVALRRTVVERTRGVAIDVIGPRLELEDVTVRDTGIDAMSGMLGRALQVLDGTEITMDRVVAEASHDGAIQIIATTARMNDVVIRGVDSQRDGLRGRGLEVVRNTVLDASHVLIEDAADIGLNLDDGPSGRLLDVVIRDVQSQPFDDEFGRALNVQRGAQIEITRTLIASVREGAVVLNNEGTTLRMSDAALLDVLPQACAVSSCTDDPRGTAVGAFRGGELTLTQFLVRGAHLCGVHLAQAASVDLADGEIAQTEIGACIQIDGYDFDRLTDGVLYRENEQNLAATTLPIPDVH